MQLIVYLVGAEDISERFRNSSMLRAINMTSKLASVKEKYNAKNSCKPELNPVDRIAFRTSKLLSFQQQKFSKGQNCSMGDMRDFIRLEFIN